MADDQAPGSSVAPAGSALTAPVQSRRTLGAVYATDADAAENGTWIILRPETSTDPAMSVKLRSAGSKRVRTEEQKLDRKYRVQIMAGNGFLDPDSQDERDVLLISRAILVDWKGMPDDTGKPLPFTPQVVQDTLRAYPQLRRELLVMARMDENFKPKAQVEAEREAMAGNS